MGIKLICSTTWWRKTKAPDFIMICVCDLLSCWIPSFLEYDLIKRRWEAFEFKSLFPLLLNCTHILSFRTEGHTTLCTVVHWPCPGCLHLQCSTLQYPAFSQHHYDLIPLHLLLLASIYFCSNPLTDNQNWSNSQGLWGLQHIVVWA